MEDTRITLETAKIAKEKGCNLENCTCGGYPDCICYDKRISQSLLAKWLREEYNIIVLVDYEGIDGYYYKFYSYKEGNKNYDASDKNYNTYEEAYEIGLQEALKLI